MNNHAPITEQVTNGWTGGWINWLRQVFQCLPWNQGLSITATIDFGAIGAQTQAIQTVAVTGARQGSVVLTTPMTDVSGVMFTGVVTADNLVTVYAKNLSAGVIDPASQVFRIIILQN